MLRDAERDFFLGIYRRAVDFYKPRIEKRTGVRLGDIKVWDYDCILQHVMAEYRRETSFWRVGILRSFLLTRTPTQFGKSMDGNLRRSCAKCGASYYRNAIYISFSGGTPHDEAVALLTVHELSHALWQKLAGEFLDRMRRAAKRRGSQEVEKYELFVEGFATYAERVWFLDFYPTNVRDGILGGHMPQEAYTLEDCNGSNNWSSNTGRRLSHGNPEALAFIRRCVKGHLSCNRDVRVSATAKPYRRRLGGWASSMRY